MSTPVNALSRSGLDMGQILSLLQQLPQLIAVLRELGIFDLFKSKGVSQPPAVPPPAGMPPRLPDDVVILPPTSTLPALTISRVTHVIRQAQYSAKLFPDAYTPDNPYGLYKDPMGMVARNEAFNRETKFWFDLTAYDQNGRELDGARIIANKLAYKTRHAVTNLATGGVTEIVGPPDGTLLPGSTPEKPKPMPGYTQSEEAGFGLGITPWEDSVGFNAPMKAYAEGEFRADADLDGHDAEPFNFRVS